MEQPIIYRGKAGTITGTLVNKFNPESEVRNPLRVTLDGVTFEGDTFTGLAPVSGDDAVAALGKFEFIEYGNQHLATAYIELINYQLEFALRLRVVDKAKEQESRIDGNCLVDRRTEAESFTFLCTLKGEDQRFSSDDFEGLFDSIVEKLGSHTYLKNCYGCAYSDYNPYGNDTFGSLLCFRNCKEAYSAVTGKIQLFEVLSLNKELTVQETYLCDQFKERSKGSGYRG